MNLDLANDLSWKSCTFEGAELHSLLLGLETSFREKIIWIEEMQKIQERIDQNRLKRLGAATEPKIP
jgi:hypothetical protein